MQPLQRPISIGADYIGISDDRFKTARLTVALLLPLSEQTASANAILPFLLRRSSREYPSFAALQRRLNQLYGTRISADVARIGNYQAMVLTAASIDDRFSCTARRLPCKPPSFRSMLFDPLCGTAPSFRHRTGKRCLAELIQSEINEKRLYARYRCEQILCEGEGYAVNRYGTLERVNQLTPEAVTQAWRDMLNSAQIRVIYQGGRRRAGRRGLRQGLGFSVKPYAAAVILRLSSGSCRIASANSPKGWTLVSKLVMGFRTGGPNGVDIPALRLANALLAAPPFPFVQKCAREAQPCYYCSSSYDRPGNVLFVDSGVEEQNVPRVRLEVESQLDAVRAGAFTEDELESARRSVINQFLTIGDLQSSLANWYLGQSLDGEPTTPEKAAEDIKEVGVERVCQAARNIKPGAVYLLAGREDADGSQ